MVTGVKRKRKEFLSVADILSMTTGGYDIYMFYIGKVSRIMQRPYGHKERQLSWGVFPYGGTWMWKDLASEESGNALHFLMKAYGLTLQEAKDLVIRDFGLQPIEGEIIRLKPKVVTWNEPTEEDKEYIPITFDAQPFKKIHHEFWNVAEVTEEHCRRYECYAVKDLSIKRKRIHIPDDEPVFAYYAPEEDATKIYFPKRGYDEFHPKFKNNVSGSYLWNYEKLRTEYPVGRLSKGLIQKSMKDLIVSTMLTDNVIAGQNEQVKLYISEHTVEKVHKLFKNVWVAFGSDLDGETKTNKIIDVNYKWKPVAPDKSLLPEINDFYSLACKYKLKGVEQLLKQTGYL